MVRLTESQDLCNIISESRNLLISVQIGNNVSQKDNYLDLLEAFT